MRPPALIRASLASDPDLIDLTYGQPKVILFGGTLGTGASSNAVWSYDGTNWTSRSSGAVWVRTPSARISPIVYDARNDRFTIFGGGDGATWGWDRSSWTDYTPSDTRPAARFAHSAATLGDSASSAVMMFGGDGITDSNTWIFSGSSWRPWTFPTGPSPRRHHAIAGIGGNAFMFGGTTGTVDSNELWRLSPGSLFATATWEQPTLAAGSPAPPIARSQHAFVSTQNGGANTGLLFGGFSTSLNQFLSDTWIWNADASRWRLSGSGCGSGPSARAGHAMAYDPVRNVVVMFGGGNSSPTGASFGELWEWDGACWRRIATPAGAAWPSPRTDAIMTYDRERGRVVMFGGLLVAPSGARSRAVDLWGATGDLSNPWIELTPAGSPMTPRSATSAAFDPARSQIVLFGGETDAGANAHTYVLSRGRGQRPGAKMTVEWTGARVETAAVRSLTTFALVAGRGYTRERARALDGAAIRIWDPIAGRWQLGSSIGAPLGAMGLLTYDTPDSDVARRLISPRTNRIEAMITSLGVDYGSQPAELQLELLGLRIDYRL